MKLTPAQLAMIAIRDERNKVLRDRARARWAEEAMARAEAKVTHEMVTIPVGDKGRLEVSAVHARLVWGPLSIAFEKFDEQQIALALERLQSPSRNWVDGTLRGVKRLLRRDGAWMSPSTGTLWVDGECHAQSVPDETQGLRGMEGVHAVWVDQLEELNHYPGRLVEVAGWGAAVVGDLGWRAEHARVVRQLL